MLSTQSLKPARSPQVSASARLIGRCLTVALLACAPRAGSPPAVAGGIEPALRDALLHAGPGDRFSTLITLREQADLEGLALASRVERRSSAEAHRMAVVALRDATRSQAPLLAELRQAVASGESKGFTSYWIANLVVAEGTAETLLRLAARPEVAWVESNFRAELIDAAPPRSALPEPARPAGPADNLTAIQAPLVWHRLGINGAGTIVANMDSGVDSDHPALRRRWRGFEGAHPYTECWLDVVHEGTEQPYDDVGHGTHVMGTIAGLGSAPTESIGVAWGAEWIASNAIAEPDGDEINNEIVRSFQWLADPDGDPTTREDVPDVVQNSWRVLPFVPPYRLCDARWWAAIDGCEAAGVVCIFSAGNEGPRLRSIGVPADRATTLVQSFAVGAVDTKVSGWPYPLAEFSSLGPSGCDVSDTLKIKPEVVAPGVQIYSAVPHGQYGGQGWNGTSFSGPHVAGVIALMRQANPDLEVTRAKEILLETARDLGDSGDDNAFGTGLIDAYAAVLAATAGLGRLEGQVRNRSVALAPLPGAQVELLGTDHRWTTDARGRFFGLATPGPQRVRASFEGFRAETTTVSFEADVRKVADFELLDIAGPDVAPGAIVASTRDSVHATTVSVRAQDPSGIAGGTLYQRAYARGETPGGFHDSALASGSPGEWRGSLEPASPGTTIEYFFEVRDGAEIPSNWPEGGPSTPRRAEVRRLLSLEEVEGKSAARWQLGLDTDDAASGRWTIADPLGTYDQGHAIQPENDHSPGVDGRCFVTANGTEGGGVGEADVDNGCTTLVSPAFPLARWDRAYLRYARWYGESGGLPDDTLQVDLSSDDGATWLPLERVIDADTSWVEVEHALHDRITLSDQVRLRVRACDIRVQGVTEAALDDIAIELFPMAPAPEDTMPEVTGETTLSPPTPNPFAIRALVSFTLASSGHVSLKVFDSGGRLVRVLEDGARAAGPHVLVWDGRDERHRRAGSGVYFVRLRTPDRELERKVVLL